MEDRGVFHDDLLGESDLEELALLDEEFEGSLVVSGGSIDAHEDIGVTEVGGQFDPGDGDEHSGERGSDEALAKQSQFALELRVQAGDAVWFHKYMVW